MAKARSRLATSLTQNKSVSHRSITQEKVSLRYLRHFPTLIIGLVFYGLVVYILTRVQPNQIKNLVVTNTYLPLQVAVFIGNFFFLSFLLLNSRRGLLLSLVLSIFLFLKLQSVIFTPQLIVSVLIPFVIIELVAHANFRQKTISSQPKKSS